MTNEQREAVETCKEKIIEPFYDFPNPTSIELKDTDVKAIEMVLSMLQEQQEKMEKKDKQIDLMAKKITMTKPTPCTRTNEFSMGRMYMSKEEIKQYFERKVEDVK